MSKVLNFSSFKSAACNVENIDMIRGGECTGGGFTRIPGNRIVSWDSDETNGGCTTFEGVSVCEE